MIKEIGKVLEDNSYGSIDDFIDPISIIEVTTEEEREYLAKQIVKAISPYKNEDGELFEAVDLWNEATELSLFECNGYWKALRDLERLGVVKIGGIAPY